MEKFLDSGRAQQAFSHQTPDPNIIVSLLDSPCTQLQADAIFAGTAVCRPIEERIWSQREKLICETHALGVHRVWWGRKKNRDGPALKKPTTDLVGGKTLIEGVK